MIGGKVKMHVNIEKLRSSTLAFVQKCHRDEKNTGVYYFSGNAEKPTLYSSTYAAMLKSLYNDLPGKAQCDEWASYIDGFQNNDGLFKDPVIWNEGWYKDDPFWCGRMHLTCHVIVALSCLGHTVRTPFGIAHKFGDIEFMRSWLSSRDWKTIRISTTGNEVMNIGTLLQYARDFHNDTKAGKAVEFLLDWLTENHINKDSGLWGTLDISNTRERSESVMAAYHFWPLFTYDGRRIPYMEKAIDSLLSTQNPNGGFGWGCHNGGNPYTSSACEDIDSIEPLCRFSKMSSFRNADIAAALERALPWVLCNQMEDGGFVFTKDNPFFYGHRQLSATENTGAMFPTWFRTLSLAYLGNTMIKSGQFNYPWHFARCPGYQFQE